MTRMQHTYRLYKDADTIAAADHYLALFLRERNREDELRFQMNLARLDGYQR